MLKKSLDLADKFTKLSTNQRQILGNYLSKIFICIFLCETGVRYLSCKQLLQEGLNMQQTHPL